jgi:hypothetical protein
MNTDSKPEVELSTVDGNAFSIISACRKAARRAGWDDDEITKVTDEMKSGNYDHLLQTAMRYFEVA